MNLNSQCKSPAIAKHFENDWQFCIVVRLKNIRFASWQQKLTHSLMPSMSLFATLNWYNFQEQPIAQKCVNCFLMRKTFIHSHNIFHSRLLTGIVHFGYFKQSHKFMLKKNILVQLVSFVNVYYLEYFAAGRCPFISTGTICHFQCFLFRAFLLSTTLSHFIHMLC